MNWPPGDPEAQRWTAIGAGLLIGLGAKYALLLQDGRVIRGRDLVIDALLLAANALMASLLVSHFGWRGQWAMAVAALFGASSDRLVRIVRRAFEKQVEQRAAVLFAGIGERTTVPASKAPTDVQVVSDKDPRTQPIEQLAALLKTVPDEKIEQLLRLLDED